MRQIQITQGLGIHGSNDYRDATNKIKNYPRLKADIEVLEKIATSNNPPRRLVRASKTSTLVYTGGDTSGYSFVVISDNGKEIKTTFGEWILLVREGNTSKYKELKKIVESLEGKK